MQRNVQWNVVRGSFLILVDSLNTLNPNKNTIMIKNYNDFSCLFLLIVFLLLYFAFNF